MRWAVKISDIASEDILADVLTEVGFNLSVDMLSGEPFEAFLDWKDVSDAAHDLAHNIRELARLSPEFELSFSAGAVHEYDADGKEVHVHNMVYAEGTAICMSASVVGVSSVTSSLSPEEQAEMERKGRAARAAELLRAATCSDMVLTIMRLLDGEPGTLELGHVHALVLDDMNGDLSEFTTKKQLTRFKQSINDPRVLGLKARHAVTNTAPPAEPMTLEEATLFIKLVAEKWIKAKAASLAEKHP